MAIDHTAVVFLVILGAFAFVFVSWAATHFFFPQKAPANHNAETHATQLAYMRDVRARNQEAIGAVYGYVPQTRTGSTLAYS
ncbi:hypothetical protein MBLNU230_g0217t1 [Neophaeotheca triangularis]